MNLLHNIIEPTFNDQATEDYLLSLLAGGDSFSYLITHADTRQVLGLRTYMRSSADKTLLQFLKRVLPQDALLKKTFRAVRLAWHSAKYTLIPALLWEEQHAETYLKTAVRVHSGEQCLHHSIAIEPSLKTVFAAESSPLNLLRQQFIDCTVSHSLSGMLLFLMQKLSSQDELTAVAHLYADTWTITILHKNKLLYHNTFKYKSASDCLYYTLAVYKYLNLNPQKNTLYLSGDLVADSEIYQLLHKYIQHISFIERPDNYVYSESFTSKIASHFYLELLACSL